jgi:hypothetical protein
MANDLIRYDLLVQDALRGVVRRVLTEVAKEGLPGEHHFYITFRTAAPGVRLSTHMRAQYPDTMTVILQHQFWDLAVSEHNFEVGLSIRNVPERLLVPFDAVTEFYDPSVQFGLKFEVEEASPEDGANDLEPMTPPAPLALAPAAVPALPAAEAPKAKPRKEAKDAEKAPARPAAEAPPADTPPAAEPGKVVSIDSFRKKH